jgi:ribonuclease-3
MDRLEKTIGYEFREKARLKAALTHSSWANENRKSGAACNERLEFLGDSILGFIVAEFLYTSEPEMPEGQMTRTRAELVCEKSLEKAANDMRLGQFLRLGRGEELSGGRTRPSILADALEAVVAAVYLDGGIEPTARLVKRFIFPQLETGTQAASDYKTALQELVQKRSGRTLTYQLVSESGPDHMKHFAVEVRLNGEMKGTGSGRSKKEAEQAAAKNALEALES